MAGGISNFDTVIRTELPINDIFGNNGNYRVIIVFPITMVITESRYSGIFGYQKYQKYRQP